MTITGRWVSRTISSVSYIAWCLTAIRYGPAGNRAFDPGGDPEHMLGQPVVNPDPAQHHRQGRPAAEQARDDAGQHPQQGRRIEQRREQQRAHSRHQMSAHTARRRRTYLLYSPNRVRKLGSERTRVGHQDNLVAEQLAELVAGAAHVPVAGDQPDRLEMMLRRASGWLLRRWTGCRPIRCRDRRSN